MVTRGALVAPFVNHYVYEGKRDPVTDVYECLECGHIFFVGFDSAAMQRLYDQYRSERYFKARNVFEPWYTREINAGVGESPEFRQKLIADFIGAIPDPDVLDYGGDRGQFIPKEYPGRYVYEVSGLTPIEGVTAITDLSSNRFAAILCCNVLEHVTDLVGELELLRRCLRPAGTLYIELPSEIPNLSLIGDGHRNWLKLISSCPKLTQLLDAASLACRFKFGLPIPPFGFVKLHEHVRFFTAKSIIAACSAAGLEVLRCSESRYNFTSGRRKMFQVLTRSKMKGSYV